MAKAEKIAARQKEIEENGLCPNYGRCDGTCAMPSELARLIVDYRTQGRSNLNHGITEAIPYSVFTCISAKNLLAEYHGARDADKAPIMICKGHDRWDQGHEKVKLVQSRCKIPLLVERLDERKKLFEAVDQWLGRNSFKAPNANISLPGR